MALPTLLSQIPAIYDGILPQELLQLSPQENLATCHNCYRAQPKNPKPHYQAKLKCCTFYPFIPNYLVGGLLSQPQATSHPGVGALKKLIRERQFVLPIGVCPPPGYQRLFLNKTSEDFGNRDDLLCPFYQVSSGGCGVWQFRAHECATFFCVSSYGEGGEKFWSAVREILSHAEMVLSQNCMLEKGFTWPEIEENLQFIKRPADDQRRDWWLESPEWTHLWQHHQDDIEGYFRSCYQFVCANKKSLKLEIENARPPTDRNNTRLLQSYLVGGTL